LAPKIIEHATALTRHNITRFPRSIVVLGQANNKAKIEFWRMERFILPEALAGDRYVRREIREILNECEEAAKSLWNGEEGLKACLSSSIGIYFKYLLPRGAKKGLVDSKQLFSDIKRLAKSVTAISWYWSTLEGLFHKILGEYNLDKDSEDIRRQWLAFVRETLSTAWEQHCASVSMGDAWSIRALVKSEGPVLRKLKDLKKQISELQS
jgi:CRISPR system Cascade subunit CasA